MNTRRKPQSPLWREIFDRLEEPLRRRAEEAASTAEFAELLLALFELSKRVNRTALGASTQLMHMINVPAHADVRSLARQIGAVEGKVDHLIDVVEQLERRLAKPVHQALPPPDPVHPLRRPTPRKKTRMPT